MLSIHRKLSPIRIGAGLAGITTISLAALALTASGSQAAEQIRDKMSAAMQTQVTPAAPVAPVAPAAPAEPPAVAAPAAPPAPSVPEGPVGKHHVIRVDRTANDGKVIKKMVIVRKDGTRQEITMPDMPDMAALQASLPEIRNGSCGKGTSPTVEHRTEGNKQIMIICSDRIAAMSAMHADQSAKLAAMSKNMAMKSALMSLQHARRTIEAQSSLSPSQRAEALKGIDEALAELRDDAKDDSDD